MSEPRRAAASRHYSRGAAGPPTRGRQGREGAARRTPGNRCARRWLPPPGRARRRLRMCGGEVSAVPAVGSGGRPLPGVGVAARRPGGGLGAHTPLLSISRLCRAALARVGAARRCLWRGERPCPACAPAPGGSVLGLVVSIRSGMRSGSGGGDRRSSSTSWKCPNAQEGSAGVPPGRAWARSLERRVSGRGESKLSAVQRWL